MLKQTIYALIIAWLTCFGIAYQLLGIPIEMVMVAGYLISVFVILMYAGGLLFSWIYMKTQHADHRGLKEIRFRWSTLRMEEGRQSQVTNWQGDVMYSWFEWSDVTKEKHQKIVSRQ